MEIAKNILAVLVLGYLRKHARGRAKMRTQARIAADLRALGLEVSTRKVRDALAELVSAGWPVGTTSMKPAGAFICEVAEDFRLGYANLVKRVRAQAARARRFARTTREALNGQRVFNFDEADNAFAEVEAAPLWAERIGERVGGTGADDGAELCLSQGARAPGGERR